MSPPPQIYVGSLSRRERSWGRARRRAGSRLAGTTLTALLVAAVVLSSLRI
jgi:hypothetical protein